MFCLIPEIADKIKKAFSSGELDFVKMGDMDSAPRRAMLEKFMN